MSEGKMKTFTGGLAIAALLGALPLAAQSITGAGATFPAPIYQKWFNDYQQVASGVQINYQAIGSGGGIRNITDGSVDFGASDGPMNDKQLKGYEDKWHYPIYEFPTVLGSDVLTYNVPGITTGIKLTPDAIAGIFLGKITKWNDPELEKNNPGVKFPDMPIVVAHRADSSGTTYCFTDYLSKVSPAWKSKVGKNTSVNWPVGLGGQGNPGVTGIVKQQTGGIGYVELIYAVENKLPYALVKNSSGAFIKPDLASTTAAAAGVVMPPDFRVSITNSSNKAAYPISTFTWLLIPSHFSDAAKGKAIVAFLHWAITKGQGEVESLDYAKLPSSVVAKEEVAIGKIKY
ncbi:MAG TPA: phosphate ABC transporter substrate-binding protein PstS [Bryobacteraceae bacterium]|jgi:phosphate transport system substrate-binding protein|nr:phosphate ABC transporter substrate-binding protein PstS [Bryobacteraceae bacterium]